MTARSPERFEQKAASDVSTRTIVEHIIRAAQREDSWKERTKNVESSLKAPSSKTYPMDISSCVRCKQS